VEKGIWTRRERGYKMSSVIGKRDEAVHSLRDAICYLHEATSPNISDYEDYRKKLIPKLVGYESRLREILNELDD